MSTEESRGGLIRTLAEKTWSASRKELRIARTVVLTEDERFQDSHAQPYTQLPPSSCDELTSIILSLRERVGLNS